MHHAAELVLHVARHNQQAHNLDASARGTGASSGQHAIYQHDPRERRPQHIVVRGEPARSVQRGHLEKRLAERLFHAVTVPDHQRCADCRRSYQDGAYEPLRLVIAEELPATAFHAHEIKREVDRRKNHEYGNHVLYERRIPISHARLLRRESARGRSAERMAEGIEPAHPPNH